MSMAALIPGLAITVEGTYDAQNQLVATKIRFKGNDLEEAQHIQAGLAENTEELEKHKAVLAAQQEALKEQQAALTEQQKKVAANQEAIAAAVARFGQLNDYYISTRQPCISSRQSKSGPEIYSSAGSVG
jgi:OOP family OmpA-OmpF porin